MFPSAQNQTILDRTCGNFTPNILTVTCGKDLMKRYQWNCFPRQCPSRIFSKLAMFLLNVALYWLTSSTYYIQVKRLVVQDDFKPNSAAVTIDFLIRKGLISPDNGEYVDVTNCLTGFTINDLSKHLSAFRYAMVLCNQLHVVQSVPYLHSDVGGATWRLIELVSSLSRSLNTISDDL